MNKFAISSLLGASATGLPRFADVLRTCTMMVQEIVTMIVTQSSPWVCELRRKLQRLSG
jgi:hypothetical protein